MSEQTLVSVLMPTYNGEQFVAETIESVLGQTYKAIELIAVDDASTDETAAIVESYAVRFPDRVRLERRRQRAGPCRRRNDALVLARGPILAWLDQDDLWLPEKTERQVEILEDRSDVGVVYTAFEAFDSRTGEMLPWQDDPPDAGEDMLRTLFVRGNIVPSISAVFRRAALEHRGLRFRDRDFSFGDDYYLWLSLALDWRFERIPEKLTRYRRHARNESSRIGRTNYHQRRIALLQEFLREFPEAGRRLGPARRRGLAGHYLDAANYEQTAGSRAGQARYFARAVATDPRWTLTTLRAQRARASQ